MCWTWLETFFKISLDIYSIAGMSSHSIVRLCPQSGQLLDPSLDDQDEAGTWHVHEHANEMRRCIDDFRASTISLKKTFGALQSDWLLGPSSTDACSQAALVSH